MSVYKERNTQHKISIITATYNSEATIANCIESVANQTYNAEHIIIDGASDDNTVNIIQSISTKCILVSEPDNGIYDAMNKGISLAKGDIVGILNSDDFYVDKYVIEKIVNVFDTYNVDCVFADLVYVKPENTDEIVRYYRSNTFTPDKFVYGLMPAHPTFFVKRKMYDSYGMFKTDYKIAADFELLVRFMLKNKISYHYLPEVLVKMRTGGVSTRNLKSNWILNHEIVRACSENGVRTNIFKVYTKYFTKIMQLYSRPVA